MWLVVFVANHGEDQNVTKAHPKVSHCIRHDKRASLVIPGDALGEGTYKDTIFLIPATEQLLEGNNVGKHIGLIECLMRRRTVFECSCGIIASSFGLDSACPCSPIHTRW